MRRQLHQPIFSCRKTSYTSKTRSRFGINSTRTQLRWTDLRWLARFEHALYYLENTIRDRCIKMLLSVPLDDLLDTGDTTFPRIEEYIYIFFFWLFSLCFWFVTSVRHKRDLELQTLRQNRVRSCSFKKQFMDLMSKKRSAGSITSGQLLSQ